MQCRPRIEVELFSRQKSAWREKFPELPHRIPSHNTFGRVCVRLAPQPLKVCFTR
ncbi:MAG: transposase family protein [Caldilineaceae bacterium SB0664_bin_22]|nr:transposase family protein [Caldilineaceae bacterium SB0664_bin_22]